MDQDELYGLPLERFVPERNTLVRALRNAREPERAGAVAVLRKPSVAAWAVNQLVRTQRRSVVELFDAGDELRRAQDNVLAGKGDAAALRVAVAHERAAVESLLDSARGLLTSDGHELSATVIGRVSETLHAAAIDDRARAQVQDGRLERELRHIGVTIGSASRARTRATRRAPSTPRERSSSQARRAARAAEAKARRELDRAMRAVSVAQGRRDQAARALREADAELDALQADVEAAARAHERARAELEGTEG